MTIPDSTSTPAEISVDLDPANAASAAGPQKADETFRVQEVATIVGGHFVHDTFSAFLSPLLPVLIEKLSLSLTLAGSLQAFTQLPAILNLFIGYAADKVSVRYFIILAPAVTATMMSLLGLAPNYLVLAFLLLIVGISVASFHAPAPAMIARVSGNRLGLGMSVFMAGGELGRTVGPLLITSAVDLWTLEGTYRLMFLGWLASAILYWRLRTVPARTEPPKGLRAFLPRAARVFAPLMGIVLPRVFLLAAMQTFLPVLMTMHGADLRTAGLSLAIWEAAGVAGALLGGTLSDRFGRKTILFLSFSVAPVMTIIFLNTSGWLLVPVLLAHGVFALSTNPVLLAVVQEHLPENRATANGLFMASTFIVRPLAAVGIGWLGDNFGLSTAFFWCAIIAMLALPSVFFLPDLEKKEQADGPG